MNTPLKLYLAISLCQQILGLTWVQILYNDPASINARPMNEWAVIWAISSVNVILGVLLTWKAYRSNPNESIIDEPPAKPDPGVPAGAGAP
jgi:hypothetical protein